MRSASTETAAAGGPAVAMGAEVPDAVLASFTPSRYRARAAGPLRARPGRADRGWVAAPTAAGPVWAGPCQLS
ncbi:hypothetical protein GCM10025874_17210 [Arenivirga flava]|uniref:Uncharacterized protein n=1 Tax=Arenivirga flava TaxID=1930060 RepID=A0AA37XB83_9MICO|nr:hypothetical protein GCM10025874_17210 [Arenivirga flava]